MKRFITSILIVTTLLVCAACAAAGPESPDDAEEKEKAQPQEEQRREEEEEPTLETTGMKLVINGEEVDVTWEENASVRALADMASGGPLVVELSAYGGFEQVGSLGTSLPGNDARITTEPGDIVLYSGDSIVLFYGSNTWSYTRLGHIENRSGDQLKELLGGDTVEIIVTVD